MAQQLEADFRKTLHHQNLLEQLTSWLMGVIAQGLKPYEGNPNFAICKTALTQMIILQLSGNKKPSPPKCSKLWLFHLISVLYDKYMVFLVEHQVPLETGEKQ
jgi:hypothetical protein